MDQIVNQHAREHLVRMLDEHLQQRELAVAQLHALVVGDERARDEVEFEAPEALPRACFRFARRCRFAPPQHRFDAREQLARVEGFGEIVVRAGFEARHRVRHAAACGHEDHRDIVARRAQLFERTQAVRVRHHDVEHDDRRPLEFEPPPQAAAIVKHGDVEPAGSEKAAQQIAHHWIVVDDQYRCSHPEILVAHREIIPFRPSRVRYHFLRSVVRRTSVVPGGASESPFIYRLKRWFA
ncbi:hypothetical protein B0G84_3882 [Paraburkholderia sp. BL8N3]|nr:hypothetical protein B0G84_3882 [Paraburkholderia sp. BL8N3]